MRASLSSNLKECYATGPRSPILSHTRALGYAAASSKMLVARGDSEKLWGRKSGLHRSTGRLNDPQKRLMNDEVSVAGMPKGHSRGKTPQRRDENEKSGEHGKGDGGNERGKPGEHRKGDG